MVLTRSINPLFSLFRLVESLEGTHVVEISLEDGRRVAEMAVQEGRICWMTAPIRECRLGDLLGRLQPRQTLHDFRNHVEALAEEARAKQQPLGEWLCHKGLVTREIVRAALARQIAGNAQNMIDACGQQPLRYRLNPLPMVYDESLTFTKVEILLAVAHNLDRLPADSPRRLFTRFCDLCDAALLFIRAPRPQHLPLPLRCHGIGLNSLSQLLRWCESLRNLLDSAEWQRLRMSPEVTWLGGPLTGWLCVSGQYRIAAFRASSPQLQSQMLSSIVANPL